MLYIDPLSTIFWILILFMIFYPSFERKIVEYRRMAKIRELESKLNAKVITMIHRMETLSFFGLPIARYITMEDAESILRAIRSVPQDKDIVLVLHTPGGMAIAAQQIAQALKERKGKVKVIVPHYAMSGGTLIALAADEVIIDKNAFLGPVDPIINGIPAVSILNAVKLKGKKAREKYLILADIAEKALKQIKDFIRDLLRDKYPEDIVEKVCEELTSGKYTHDFPITAKTLIEWGLNVKTDVPKEVYELLELYPQPRFLTSVEYLKGKKNNKNKKAKVIIWQ